MLDVPDDHTDQLIEWGNRMIGNTDPDYADVLLHSEESEQYRLLPFRSPAVLEVFEYGRELAAAATRRRRHRPGEQAGQPGPEDGLPLSDRDFDNYFLLLVVAGNETTRHAITHTMRALIDHPDQMALLQAEPELIPDRGRGVPALGVAGLPLPPDRDPRRGAARQADQGGRQGRPVVRLGQPRRGVFDDPYRFDVTRTPNDHVTFGKGGPHFCLGNQLARMEIRIMFEELLPRLAGDELAGDVRRVRSNFVNGIKKFPVAVPAGDEREGGEA